MYAIVNIAGQQFKVEKDQKLFVHRLSDKEGDTVKFDEVLLIDNDKNVLIGEPTIKGAMITGKVLSHSKADKVQVFKKKRRKGYKVQTGHRQYLTHIQIQDIIEKGATKEAAPKAAVKAATKPETEAKKKTTEKATPKKPAAKAAPASKTTATKKPAVAKKTTAAKKSTGTTAKAAPKKPAADKKDKE
ncbi:50S ribosomal protein L21 [Bacteroidota bacterium]